MLIISYIVRSAIFALLVLIIVFMVCGVLYIKEHFAHIPESVLPGNIETDEPDPAETSVATVTPAIPGGVTVVLDAGHGGVQSGCEIDGVLEKDITLAVVFALKEKLETSGICVVLTRSGDQDVSLDERCIIANASDANLFISIHCNSYTDDTSIKEFEGYYYQDPDGRRLADLILGAVENYPLIKIRNIKEENYKVLRDTEMPAVLLEIGYLSNIEEWADLQSIEYQNTLAQAIFEGIIAMLP